MQFSGFCSALILVVFSAGVSAEQGAWALFDKVQHAVKQYNFDTSFVVLKGNKVDTYRWLHGKTDEQEIEHLIPLDTSGVDILRRNSLVYYLLTDRPPFVTRSSSITELPAVLFESRATIEKLYHAVAGSNSVMSGRTAQLLRLTALAGSRFSYWLWLDAETGFPLRVDTVDADNQVLERWMVVHMQLKPTLPTELVNLLSAELPAEPVQLAGNVVAESADFQLGWLPEGYQLAAQQTAFTTQNNAVLASWLLTDTVEASAMDFYLRLREVKRLAGHPKVHIHGSGVSCLGMGANAFDNQLLSDGNHIHCIHLQTGINP